MGKELEDQESGSCTATGQMWSESSSRSALMCFEGMKALKCGAIQVLHGW